MMMSDAEELQTNSLKMELVPLLVESAMEGQEEGQEESQEEGQEEWLSEGVLTDDDYLGGNVLETSEEHNNSTANGTVDNQESDMVAAKAEPVSNMEQNIEDTLNNFERVEKGTKDAFDDLLKIEKESDIEPSDKQSEDDGHNTDDLLRMLGGDDSKKKVLSSMRDKHARRRAEPSSDDEYVFEGAKVTRLKVAKNAVIRKQPVKAEPEDLSDRDSDMSDDDANTVKKMFGPKGRTGAGRPKPRPSTNIKTEKPKPKSTTPKQYGNKNKSLLKTQDKPKEHEEIINDEEFLEEDDFDLDDDIGTDSSLGSGRRSQPLRRPERMDEDVPSDEESLDDDSLYDVMPSSDSEDMDDWFTLDIRAERAGDYLPWLGDKAQKLLTEEKHRVTARLSALRQSVTALQSSGRVQSDQIKVATEALHELDAMLAAA